MSVINRRIEKNTDMKKKITTMIKKEVRNDKKKIIKVKQKQELEKVKCRRNEL